MKKDKTIITKILNSFQFKNSFLAIFFLHTFDFFRHRCYNNFCYLLI